MLMEVKKPRVAQRRSFVLASSLDGCILALCKSNKILNFSSQPTGQFSQICNILAFEDFSFLKK